MAAIAKELHLSFMPKGGDSFKSTLTGFDLFTEGKFRQVENLMRGNINHLNQSLSVAIFDYYYTIGSNDDSKTFSQTVLLLHDQSLNVPNFSLRPEHLFDKIGNIFGWVDINFSKFPNFSKRYRLLSNQEQKVRSLFQPDLLKFYESQKICTEAKGSYVLIFPFSSNENSQSTTIVNGKTFTESKLLQPNEIKTFLQTGLRLLSLLKQNS